MSVDKKKIAPDSKLSPLFVDTEFVPTDLSYFTLYTDPKNRIPTVLPYNEKQSFQQLQAFVSQKQPPEANPANSIAQHKLQMGRKYINGDEMEISPVSRRLQPKTRENNQRCEICCIMLDSKEEVFRLQIRGKDNPAIRSQILQSINQIFSGKLKDPDFQVRKVTFSVDTKIVPNNILYDFDTQPLTKITSYVLSSQHVVFLGIKVLTNFTFQSKVDQGNLAVSLIDAQDTSQLLKITHSQTAQEFYLEYQRFKQYQVREVLAILGIDKPELKGLRMASTVFPPNTKIYSFSYLFKEGLANRISMEVASERDVLISDMMENDKIKPADLQKLVDEDVNYNKSKRYTHYKPTNLGLFCSNLSLHINTDTSYKLLYHIINEFIRRYPTHVYDFTVHSICARISHGLFDEVSSLPKFGGNTFRQVGFEMPHRQGDIFEFSSFIVTSKSLKIIQQISEKRPSYTRSTWVTFLSKTGRAVEKESSFSGLEEVVFLPYTKFEVVERIEEKNQVILMVKEVEEVRSEAVSNILLWVDNKLAEGRKLFESSIGALSASIRLLQLESTEKFKDMIARNPKWAQSKSINILVITNMFRIENGKENPLAGIETLETGKKLLPNAKYIVYIGNKEVTMSTLEKYSLKSFPNLVTNRETELKEFLFKQFNPGFQKPKNKILDEVEDVKPLGIPTQDWREYFPEFFEVEEAPVVLPKVSSKDAKGVKQAGIQLMKQQLSPEKYSNFPIQINKVVSPEKIGPKPMENLQPLPPTGSYSKPIANSNKPVNFIQAPPPPKAEFEQPVQPKSTIFQGEPEKDRFAQEIPINKDNNDPNLYSIQPAVLTSKLPSVPSKSKFWQD